MSSQHLHLNRISPVSAVIALCLLVILTFDATAQTSEHKRLYVRFHTIPTMASSIFEMKLPNGGTFVQPLLKPEQALSYNQPMSLKQSPTGTSKQSNESLRQAEETLLRTYIIEYDGSVPLQKYMLQLQTVLPDIELLAPYNTCKLQYTPNDPQVSSQTYLNAMNIFDAWDSSRGNPTVLIGVTDSGLRSTHEDIINKIAVNKGETPNNGIDDDNNGYVDDYSGFNVAWQNDNVGRDNVFNPGNNHGMCVAGIIGAEQNNSKGISGVSGLCKIVPVKAVRNGNNSVVYGYESIIYAAIRGCKVINCSWGNDSQVFNPVEQSIIDFAVSRDAAVVVSAGNITIQPTDPFFPASYRGVLSVGETEVNGALTGTSSFGAHCSILAPGNSAITTDIGSDDDYTLFNGTSSAAPMVSGVVALVRSKYPNLTALQAIEHVRVTARSVASNNPGTAELIPGMVDAKAALTTQPFSRPSLRALSYSLSQTDGTKINRLRNVGDTARVAFQFKNYLGGASNCTFTLRVVNPSGTGSPVTVLDSVISVANINRDQEVVIGQFTIVVNQLFSSRTFFRIAISADGGYEDVALLDFLPITDFQNIGNDNVTCSIGDFGWIGTNNGTDGQTKGIGYSKTPYGNMLYRGGLVLTNQIDDKIRSGIASDIMNTDNDFDVVSTGGRPYSVVLTDTKKSAQAQIGMDVRQSFVIPDDTGSTIQNNIRITNRTMSDLRGIAVGCFFDWDITVLADSSRVRLFPEAVLNTLSNQMAAELMTRTSRDPVVGAAVLTTEADGEAQAAGLDGTFTGNNFSNANRMLALNSGTSLQSTSMGDMSIMIGMKYTGVIKAGEERLCTICFGAAPNEDVLAQRLKACLQNRVLSVATATGYKRVVTVQPHPAISHIVMSGLVNVVRVRLYSLIGELLVVQEIGSDNQSQNQTLDVRSLSSGCYLLTAEYSDGTISTQPFIVQQ